MNDESAFKNKYFFIVIIILIASIGGLYAIARFVFSSTSSNTTNSICATELSSDFKTSFTREVPTDFPWWNDTYSHTKQFLVENTHESQVLQTDCWVAVEFNHEELVDEKKSQEDGLDLKLVYRENGSYKEISFVLVGANTSNARVEFRPGKELAPGVKDGDYFLYYSNILAESNESILSKAPDDRTFSQVFKSYRTREINPKVTGTTSRQWIIKDEYIDDELTKLVYTLDIDSSVTPSKTPTYTVIGTNEKGTLTKVTKGEYVASLSPSNLAPGKYQIQATVKEGATEHKTPKSFFFVSEPLFVTITIDYEGSDVPDENLNEMLAFAEGHPGLPLVHLFNPRVYVATDEISEERADYLSQWMLVRKLNGDEVGMHLHMRYDMVEAAGVTPKSTPKWTNYLSNGHDVPCSAYSYNEFDKIVKWALDQFLQEGLGSPTSFRAGGWFADETTLKVLDANGFIIDTSGRDYTSYGGLGMPWNLNSTTKPYHPSESNQNASSPAPLLRLWEFPNNGADSYNFTSDQMISRFNDNYKKQPMTIKQTVTYLTHPHDFKVDREKLDPVFTYIDQYLARNDNGPVVYSTLEKALRSYE